MAYDRALYQMYLSRIPMFRSCSTEQLDLIAQLGDAVTIVDGHDVVTEGDVTDGFYVITAGRATVKRGGREVADLEPGDYFGELSLFDPAPRNATVTAGASLSCVKMTRVSRSRRPSTRFRPCATRSSTAWPTASTSSTSASDRSARRDRRVHR